MDVQTIVEIETSETGWNESGDGNEINIDDNIIERENDDDNCSLVNVDYVYDDDDMNSKPNPQSNENGINQNGNGASQMNNDNNISESESESEEDDWSLMSIDDDDDTENDGDDDDDDDGDDMKNTKSNSQSNENDDDELQDQSGTLVNIISSYKREYRSLNVSGLRLELKFRTPSIDSLSNMTKIMQWLHQCFVEVLNIIEIELEIQPHDRVGLVFNNTNNVKSDFSLSFRPFNQYSADSILSEIEHVIQSNSKFFIDDNLIIKIDHVRIPVGFGRRSHIGKSSDAYYKLHSKSIFSPNLQPEDHGLCLAISIVVGICHVSDDINKFNHLTYTPNYSDLIGEAKKICTDAGVNLQHGGSIDEIIQFQQYLGQDYRIVVYTSRDGKECLFRACHDEYKYTLHLLLDENHYSLVLSPTAAFATAYFCGYCCIGYSTKFGHKRCRVKCNKCYQSPPCERIVSIKCNACNREFANATCLQNHVWYNVCAKFKLCKTCCISYSVRKNFDHICGTKYCKVCREVVSIRHECYITPTRRSAKPKFGVLYVFYDFECFQTKNLIVDDPSKKEHEVNLCVAQQACDVCRENPKNKIICKRCGKRQHKFWGNNIIHDFMQYLGGLNDKFTRVIVIAHNSQKYDAHFILRYMYANSTVWKLYEHSLIINGTKIMRIRVGRYCFIDSLNFFNVGLAKLPKMFSLENNCKGYYPHAFNTPDNMNYVGAIPAIEYFWPDNLKPDDREKLLTWYEAEKSKNAIFNNRKELLKYCIEDVNILRAACLKFRALLHDLTEVEPFYQVTLAGTSMAVFTTKFMEERQIAIIPRNGYRFTDNQSFKALKWLEWEGHNRNLKIHSAVNGREVRIAANILVDGFCEETNTVFSFLGCYWHQCVQCFPNQYHNDVEKTSKLSLLYETCRLRANKIRELGFELIEIWEHEFDALIKTRPEIELYISTLDHLKIPPLDPRDAFMGGRTGVCKMYHKAAPGEKILYSDVTSLYPYVNKYGRYPIGTPKILLGNELNYRNVFNIDGLLKVDILPPKRLYHPVLGIKMHNKLIFSLCYTCTKEMNDAECTHSVDERQIHGTYVADELRLAVRKGYFVKKIYEAWEYDTTQYDKVTQEGGIFAKYVDLFLKIKTEASGFPHHCRTPAEKDKYIRDFEMHEGIKLEPDKITRNEGLRSLAKLELNSLWGRFGMRQDKTKKVFVNTANHLLNLMTNPSLEVPGFVGLSDDSLLVSYNYKAECLEQNPKVNVVLAAYTTALARIHLYGYLDRLQTRCLYHDTDSVIYTCKENEYPLPLGDYLGDLTDELYGYGEGSFISEAVFSAEKSYAYIVKVPNEDDAIVCKVKGITLNHQAAQKINFESMKNLVLNERNKCISLDKNNILRTNDSRVFTAQQDYKFKVNSNKRIKIGVDKIETRPYGFY